MTLKEYLEDYASEDTKKKGEEVIRRELDIITNPVVKEKAAEYIDNIHKGKRDFRFWLTFLGELIIISAKQWFATIVRDE